MDRLRQILFEGAVIFFVGIILASLGYLAWSHLRPPSLQSFVSQYVVADAAERERLADHYMKEFPVSELLAAVEEHYTDMNSLCHVEGHPIGRAVYKKTQNFTESIKQCGGSCTYGCFHGALMEMFKTESDTLGGVIEDESSDAYLARVKSLAKDLCTKPEVEGVVRGRYCYHGLGHVFAFIAGNDLSKAVDSCGILKEFYARKPCASGVFMEYLFKPETVKELETKGKEPCDAFPTYLDQCYRYKAYGWIQAWGGYAPAMRACDAFDEDKHSCIRSVAQSQATITLVETKEEFETLCSGLTGDDRVGCIAGALLRTIELNNGDDSDHACDRIEEPYRAYCVDFLHDFLADTPWNPPSEML